MFGFSSRSERRPIPLPAEMAPLLNKIRKQSRAMEVCRALLAQAKRAEAEGRRTDAETFWREVNAVLNEAGE